MILQKTIHPPVETNAILSQSKFRIKTSAKAFKILSSGIYSNLIAAPIRELAANAWDAHKEANNPEPFVVHLPNSLEPFFSIRDFGTGMNEEKILNLYTTYFDSDKNHTNQLIGGLGLGSKSPFCYTDSFTVTSYQNGIKLVFTAFILDGEPNIAKFNEEKTDQKDGLEVSFAVEQKDIKSFQDNAYQIYSLFKEKPIVKGVANFQLKNPEYLIKGNGWGIKIAQNNGYYGSNSVAIMGNIGYKIDPRQIKCLSTEQSSLLSSGIDIEFNIGELEITASREELQYDENTSNVLKSMLNSIILELKNVIQKEFDECKNLWEAKCLFCDLFSGYGSSRQRFDYNLQNVLGACKFSWKDKEISKSYEDSFDEFKKIPEKFFVTKIFYGTGGLRRGYTKKTRSESFHYVTFSKNVEFFKQDIKMGSTSRVKNYIENNQNKIVYLIKSDDQTLYDKFFDFVGYPKENIQLVSTLSKAPRILKNPSDRINNPTEKKAYLFRENGTKYCYDARSYWTEEHVPINGPTYYYVELDRFYIRSPFDKNNNYIRFSSNEFQELISLMRLLEPKKFENIHGVQVHCCKKIKTKNNWINFFEYSKKTIENYLEKNKQQICDSERFLRFSSSYGFVKDLVLSYERSNEKILNDILLTKFFKEYDFMFQQSTDLNRKCCDDLILSKLLNCKKISDVPPTHNIEESLTKIFNKYPLLRYIKTFDEESIKYITEYTKLIEKLK